jgi:hypothetical protein
MSTSNAASGVPSCSGSSRGAPGIVASSGISAGCAQTVTSRAMACSGRTRRMNWMVSPSP